MVFQDNNHAMVLSKKKEHPKAIEYLEIAICYIYDNRGKNYLMKVLSKMDIMYVEALRCVSERMKERLYDERLQK